MLSISLASILARHKSNKLVKIELKNLEKNKMHLQNLIQNDLKDSKNLNQKRKNKIEALKKEQKKLKKKADNQFCISALWNALELLGIVANVSTPFCLIPLVVGLLGSDKAMNTYLKHSKDKIELEARISNLVNDLDIIKVQRKIKVRKQEKQRIKTPSNQKENTKIKLKNESYIPIQVFTKDAAKQNEEAIDKYIKSLETKQKIEKQKYRVKY